MARESNMKSPAPRLIALEGGCNFRDIGGYRTSTGRTVCRGRIYRSGVLSYLTAGDALSLAPLNIRVVCDLRRSGERKREPTVWPTPIHIECSDDGQDAPAIGKLAARHPPTADGMRAAMMDLYRALPVWMGPRLRGLFASIEANRMPLIIHCSAGKDRTGFAVAVLLGALGVPHESILQDYLMSNTGADYEQFILSRQTSELGLTDAQHPLLEMPAEVRRVLFSAEPDFLESAFEQLRSRFGALETYLEFIGVSERTRGRIQDLLLD